MECFFPFFNQKAGGWFEKTFVFWDVLGIFRSDDRVMVVSEICGALTTTYHGSP